MLILDTDHATEFQRGTSPAALRLYDRLKDSGESYGTTIVSIEEVMRGWMAAIRRSSDPVRQVNSYRQLRQLFRFFATWQVYDWTLAAASKFYRLEGFQSSDRNDGFKDRMYRDRERRNAIESEPK